MSHELDPQPLEVLPDVEDQLELAHVEAGALEQRLVDPAIGIRVAGKDMMGVIAMHHQEVEAHAASRCPMHGIEYVRRQASNTRHLVILPPLGRTIGKNVAPSKGAAVNFLPTGPISPALSRRGTGGITAG